jgi:hypothetical protein
MKRDGRSTQEVKVASSSAESSDEAYFCANYRSRNGRPRVGLECNNAGHGPWARLGEPEVNHRYDWMQTSYQGSVPSLGFSYQNNQDPHGDRAATCEVAESGTIGMPRTGAFPLPQLWNIGLVARVQLCNCATPTPYRGSLEKCLHFTGTDKSLGCFEPPFRPPSRSEKWVALRDREILDAPAWLNTRPWDTSSARLDWWETAPSDS